MFQNPFNQISGAKFTVYYEIAFGLENLGVPREEIQARVEEALAVNGIRDLADRSPYSLSGGQQQRVAVARAIVNQPILLMADEPTGNLDSEHGNEVMQTLVQLNQEGTTILMVTHSLENASYGSKTIRLHDGRILLEKLEARVNG